MAIKRSGNGDQHHTPPTWSDERTHILTRDCWCNPEVEYEYGNPNALIAHRQAPWSDPNHDVAADLRAAHEM